jgi:hypothetical protein
MLDPETSPVVDMFRLRKLCSRGMNSARVPTQILTLEQAFLMNLPGFGLAYGSEF